MPQDGSNNYQYPPGTPGVPDQTIESEAYNTFLDDLVTNDLNIARPIHRGGTGASTASEALVNLSGEKATQLVTNYDAHVWLPGSFRSSNATGQGAPVDGHAFAGICYINEPYVYPLTNANVIVEARDQNDTIVPGQLYVREKKAGVWNAWSVQAGSKPRNRIVNGAMQISQQNSDTAGTTTAYYGADQFATAFVGAGTYTTQRVQAVTPRGSSDRYRITITTADAALAAGDNLVIISNIEGNRVADFRYGSASAGQAILRFGLKAPAGTYSISLVNSAANRSYVANFTISAEQANIDTEQTFVIPGDVTGTWLTDTGIGVSLRITLAAGTTFQGAAGWSAGLFYGTSSNTNGMATISSVFELFDVGLYLDADEAGTPPAWEMPDPVQELATCQRYYNKLIMFGAFQATVSNETATYSYPFSVVMRAAPTVSTNADGSATNVFSAAFDSATSVGCRIIIISTSTGLAALNSRTGQANARL